MRRTGTTRRGALTATGALALGAVLTGCSNGEGPGGRHTSSAAAGARAASVRADRTLRKGAARTSASLLARYDGTVTAHPSTAAGLAPLRSAVQLHAKALSGGAVPTVAARTPGSTQAPAADARTALKELAAEERRAADTHAKSLLNAGPELARLLASVAAAGAAHAYLLGELAKETSS